MTGYLLIKDGAYDNLDRSLEETAAEAAAGAARSDVGGFVLDRPSTRNDTGARPREAAPVGSAATFIQTFEAGKPLADARIAGAPGATAPALPVHPVGAPRTVSIRGERYRVLVRSIAPSPDPTPKPRTLMVARPVSDIESTLDEAATRLGLGAAGAAVLALGVALLAARRGLRPLVRVKAAAEQVAASDDLAVRIDEGPPAEVGAVAVAMNRMLARLQSARSRLSGALEEQRRFAADASHELRTPLTALRGNIDLLQRHDLPAGERAEVLEDMATAAERMGRMVEDLLLLARSEAEARGQDAEVDIAATLRALTTDAEELALPAGRPLTVRVDPSALDGLFRNLLDNARRHGTRVSVDGRAENGEVVIEVADDGPGVRVEDRERIFDRFYRAPGLRSTSGTGLGLAIARTAAERAGGGVRLIDSERGARFEVRLPLSLGGR